MEGLDEEQPIEDQIYEDAEEQEALEEEDEDANGLNDDLIGDPVVPEIGNQDYKPAGPPSSKQPR